MYEEQTGQQIKNLFTSAFRSGREIAGFIKKIKEQERGTLQPETLPNEFIPTGQYYDLGYFYSHDSMSQEMLREISMSNPEAFAGLDKTFAQAIRDGLLETDTANARLVLTEKGRAYLKNNPDLADKFLQSQNAAKSGRNLTVKEFGVTLNGTDADLSFFRHANVLDLKQIVDSPDELAAEKILVNVGRWMQKGFVHVDGSGIVRLLPKGKEAMNSALTSFVNGAMVEKAAGAVPVAGQVFVVTKKILEVASKVSNAVARENGRSA